MCVTEIPIKDLCIMTIVRLWITAAHLSGTLLWVPSSQVCVCYHQSRNSGNLDVLAAIYHMPMYPWWWECWVLLLLGNNLYSTWRNRHKTVFVLRLFVTFFTKEIFVHFS